MVSVAMLTTLGTTCSTARTIASRRTSGSVAAPRVSQWELLRSASKTMSVPASLVQRLRIEGLGWRFISGGNSWPARTSLRARQLTLHFFGRQFQFEWDPAFNDAITLDEDGCLRLHADVGDSSW